MADYLLPECSMSVNNKTYMFAFRCDMNTLPNNVEHMNNEHLLNCVYLN